MLPWGEGAMTSSGKYRRVCFFAAAGTLMILGPAGLRTVVSAAPAPVPTATVPAAPVLPPYSGKRLVYPIADEPDAECGRLYATPLGFFWGKPEHGNDLEAVMHEQSTGHPHAYERGTVVMGRGDVVIDGGSHLGVFTRIAVLRGASRVVAFEPQPDLVACFRRTFAKEIASGQVTMVAKAVWDQPGTLAFEGAGLGFHAVDSQISVSSTTGRLMPVTTIDDTVEALGLKRVDFIKMDIEGAERQALRGARRTIARWKPNLSICAYHRPDDAEAIPAAVRNARRDYHVLGAPGPEQHPPSLLLRFPRAGGKSR
jgi:FkbM family methyltransferase